MNILVLCTGNSCRSQMAEAYLRHFAPNHYTIYSAGIETHGLNPDAVATLLEDGIDISHHTSNHVSEYAHISFDVILTVCDHASENCPYIPGKALRLHHNFQDPSKQNYLDPEVKKEAFRTTRIEVKMYCQKLINELSHGKTT